MAKKESFKSKVWRETPETSDIYLAAKCTVSGFDLYGDMLGKASWIEYLYLLFKLQPPAHQQAVFLNDLAVAIACSGPRDLSTQAACSAAAGGSTLASCLSAALAVGAGQYGGAREVYLSVLAWEAHQQALDIWKKFLTQKWPIPSNSIWPDQEHPPGFDPNASICSTPIQQTLAHLSGFAFANNTRWLKHRRLQLEEFAGMPISLSGVASAAFTDLGFDSQQAEMLFLLLRLPGAAALSLEQHWRGWKDYPFFTDKFVISHSE